MVVLSAVNKKYANLAMALKLIGLFVIVEIFAIISHALFIIAINIYYIKTLGNMPQATDAINAAVNNLWIQAGMIILGNVFFVLIAWMFLKIDREKFSLERLGLTVKKDSPRLFLAGMAIDASIFLPVMLLMILTGVITYQGFGPSLFGLESVALSFIVMMVATLTVGIGEEVLFRGYLQRMLTGRYGIMIALPVASVIFILVHTLPSLLLGQVSLLYLLSIGPIALILGYLFYKTGSLWASIGFHFLEDFLALDIFFQGNKVQGTYPVFMFSKPEDILPSLPLLGNWGDLVFLAVGTIALLGIYAYYRKKPEIAR